MAGCRPRALYIRPLPLAHGRPVALRPSLHGIMRGIAPVSNNEKEFVVEALRQEVRHDGRKLYDFRPVSIKMGLDDASGESPAARV